MTLPEFFFLVEAGELDQLDTADYIELVTNHYKPDRLKILLDGINIQIGIRRDEVESSLQDKIKAKITEYKNQGRELPIEEIKFPSKFNIETTRILDKDKLLGGEITWQLYPLYELRRFVNSKLGESLKTGSSSEIHKGSITTETIPENTDQDHGLEQYLNEEGLKYFPILMDLYKNHNPPGDQARMLFALNDLGLLSINPSDISATDYQRTLKITFGEENAITRSAVYYQFGQAETTLGKTKIQKERLRIKKAIDALNSAAEK